MNLTGGVVLYLSIWFIVLFVVLPVGQRSQADMGPVVPGTPPGAPSGVPWRRKLFLTTLITTILWGICAWLILGGVITRAHIENLDHLLR